MVKVVIYSTEQCPYCHRAEALLAQKGVTNLLKIGVDTNQAQLALMIERSGRRSVPQIFINDVHVGGFDDLVALDRAKKLDALLLEA